MIIWLVSAIDLKTHVEKLNKQCNSGDIVVYLRDENTARYDDQISLRQDITMYNHVVDSNTKMSDIMTATVLGYLIAKYGLSNTYVVCSENPEFLKAIKGLVELSGIEAYQFSLVTGKYVVEEPDVSGEVIYEHEEISYTHTPELVEDTCVEIPAIPDKLVYDDGIRVFRSEKDDMELQERLKKARLTPIAETKETEAVTASGSVITKLVDRIMHSRSTKAQEG